MLPDLLRHSPQFRGRLLEPAVPSQVREAILRACTASAPTPAPAHECPPDVPSSPSLRILVAEDNRVNQILIESILKKLGHRIETAPDGQAAVDAFARETFDLVLMDIQMPRLDGLEATREIRRREEGSGRRTPIVALTADVVESTEVRCREAGMDAYLLKPFARDEILAVVDWVTPRSAVRE